MFFVMIIFDFKLFENILFKPVVILKWKYLVSSYILYVYRWRMSSLLSGLRFLEEMEDCFFSRLSCNTRHFNHVGRLWALWINLRRTLIELRDSSCHWSYRACSTSPELWNHLKVPPSCRRSTFPTSAATTPTSLRTTHTWIQDQQRSSPNLSFASWPSPQFSSSPYLSTSSSLSSCFDDVVTSRGSTSWSCTWHSPTSSSPLSTSQPMWYGSIRCGGWPGTRCVKSSCLSSRLICMGRRLSSSSSVSIATPPLCILSVFTKQTDDVRSWFEPPGHVVLSAVYHRYVKASFNNVKSEMHGPTCS